MNITPDPIITRPGQVMREAGEILSTTMEAGGDTYREAKACLGGVKESGRKILDNMKDNLVGSVRAADSLVQVNFHVAIAVGIGMGALIGLLVGWKLTRANGHRDA